MPSIRSPTLRWFGDLPLRSPLPSDRDHAAYIEQLARTTALVDWITHDRPLNMHQAMRAGATSARKS